MPAGSRCFDNVATSTMQHYAGMSIHTRGCHLTETLGGAWCNFSQAPDI